MEAWPAYVLSWVGAGFDLTIGGWLLWGKSRPLAYLAVVGFHAATGLLFQIGIFPWLMMAGALIFFSPNWPQRLLQRLGGLPRLGRSASSELPKPSALVTSPANRPVTGPPGWLQRCAVVGILLFTVVQIIIPLRHLAYPGNVRWNEEGYRFSWRVLLNEKAGYTLFRVREPASNRAWLVDPGEYLSPVQTERMSLQPDMILATSQIIAQDFRERGYQEVEVRADAFVSMNGRPARRLIDPEVNLASQSPGIGPKPWILTADDQ